MVNGAFAHKKLTTIWRKKETPSSSTRTTDYKGTTVSVKSILHDACRVIFPKGIPECVVSSPSPASTPN